MNSPHFCYDCAFKHMSMARINWNEVSNGWRNTDHISYVVGNMSLAEIHIFELHDKIAGLIRDERKQFWDAILCGDNYRPDFEVILERIMDAATEMDDETGMILGLTDLDVGKEIKAMRTEEEEEALGK